MDIRRYSDNSFNVNSYFIEENNHSIVIDPILTERTWEEINRHPIDFAILTHEHYDHIINVNEINKCRLFPVYCGQATSITIKDPKKNLSRYSEFLLEFIPFIDKTAKISIADYSCECENILHDGQSIAWQGHKLFIKETPGHSKGSICILLDGEHLFSGDTVFSTFETALRLPGGSRKDYRDSTLKWLDSLSPDTMVYPGHMEPFPIKNKYPLGYEK